MTKEQKLEAYSMRLDGYSHQEIADHFGLSRQRIQQIIPGGDQRIKSSSACIYPNFEKWRRRKGLTIYEVAKKIGISSVTLSRALSAKGSLSKKTIDRILEITGMTYEEAFSLS